MQNTRDPPLGLSALLGRVLFSGTFQRPDDDQLADRQSNEKWLLFVVP